MIYKNCVRNEILQNFLYNRNWIENLKPKWTRANKKGGGDTAPPYPPLAANKAKIPYPYTLLKHLNSKSQDWMRVRTISLYH